MVLMLLLMLILLMIVMMAAVVLMLLVLVFLMIVVVAAVMLMLLLMLILLMIVMMAAVVLVLLVLILLVIVVMMVSAVHGIAILVRNLFRVLIVVMMVMMLLGTLQHLRQNLTLQILLALNGLQHHLSIQLRKRGCDDRRLLVVLTNQGNRLINFLLRRLICTCQNNSAGILNLIDKELAEILKVNPCLRRIHYSYGTAQLHIRNFCSRLLDGAHYVIELADTGGLNQDALRLIILHHLLERRIKISHQ